MEIFANDKHIDSSLIKIKQIADLTKLDNNKWYPYRIYKNTTISTSTNPGIADLREFHIYAPLDISGSPSYGAHGTNKGAFSTMTVLAAENSWGIRDDNQNFGYILDMDNNYISDNKKCIAIKISMNQLGFFAYLRGGLKYQITFDSDLIGKLYVNGFTQNDETYNPVNAEPSNDSSLIDLKSKLGGGKAPL